MKPCDGRLDLLEFTVVNVLLASTKSAEKLKYDEIDVFALFKLRIKRSAYA